MFIHARMHNILKTQLVDLLHLATHAYYSHWSAMSVHPNPTEVATSLKASSARAARPCLIESASLAI